MLPYYSSSLIDVYKRQPASLTTSDCTSRTGNGIIVGAVRNEHRRGQTFEWPNTDGDNKKTQLKA